MEKGELRVRQALTWTKEDDERAVVFADPKTDKSKREIPIGAPLAKSLSQYRRTQAERAMRLGPAYDRSLDLVFANELGRPLDGRNVAQRYFAQAVKRAKIEARVRLYDLRHTAATQLLSLGINVTTVSERLGHKSAKMTLDVYSHVLPGQQREATAAIEGALLGG